MTSLVQTLLIWVDKAMESHAAYLPDMTAFDYDFFNINAVQFSGEKFNTDNMIALKSESFYEKTSKT